MKKEIVSKSLLFILLIGLNRFNEGDSFSSLMKKVYPYFPTITSEKPLAVIEFGVMKPDSLLFTVNAITSSILINIVALVIV